MTRLMSAILTPCIILGCASHSQYVGLMNNTGQEITIETKPNIESSGLLSKFIGIEEDHSNRGLVWKFNRIDCIILYPKTNLPERDSLGRYIMMPNSSFDIGRFYEPTDIEFSDKCLEIDYLKIITNSDTTVLRDRQAIWNALNYDAQTKRNRKIFYDKALIVK